MQDAISSTSSSSTRPTWSSLLQSAVLRFAVVYWTLYCVFSIMRTEIAGLKWTDRISGPLWRSAVGWIGDVILAVPVNTANTGSGDRIADWITVLCCACLGALAALAWLVFDRRQARDARWRELVSVVVRYTLAFAMLQFGVIKIFALQFPALIDFQLLERFGDASPMGLLWAFMGSSHAYVVFSGIAEALGAVLLLFRRTTTLGALVLACVLVNIVALNFCYDVPVKLASSHFLALSIFMLVPVLGRLTALLVLHRPIQPRPLERVIARRWLRRTRWIVKYGLIAIIAFLTVQRNLPEAQEAPVRWYTGYWQVERFTRDGSDVPARATDRTRWERLKFESYPDKTLARWRFMDDTYGELYEVTFDEHVMHFAPAREAKPEHPAAPFDLTYVRGDGDRLTLDGTIGAQVVHVELAHLFPDRMLLVTRDFHWISEVPFNR